MIGIVFMMIAVLMAVVFQKNNDIKKITQDDVISSVIENSAIVEKVTVSEMREQIAYVEGSAETRKNFNAGWRAVEGGEMIRSGNDVRTLAGSRAVVTCEDGSIVRLNENTKITVASGANVIALVLRDGEVFNKVIKDADRLYRVEADGVRVTALGTAFGVTKVGEGKRDVTVRESDVAMSNNKGLDLGTVSTGEKSRVADNQVAQEDLDDEDVEKAFIAWNIEKEELKKAVITKSKKEKIEEKKTKEAKEKVTEEKKETYTGKMSLYGKQTDAGIKLTWEAENSSVPHGSTVLRSTGLNPTYPVSGSDQYKYLSDKNVRHYHWTSDAGKRYHFRVCVYKGGKCGTYSNNVEVSL